MRLGPLLLSVVLLTLASVSGALAAAPRTEVTIDPDQAAAKAKLVLPGEADMPGKGWLGLTDIFPNEDDEEDLLGLIPDTAACSNSSLALEEMLSDVRDARVARTNVSFASIDTKDPDGLSVLILVEVYHDGALTDLAADLKSIYGPDYMKCADEATRQFGADSKITFATPAAKAPVNGGAVAFDQDVPSLKAKVHQEVYDWVDGNVRLLVQFTGGKSVVTPQLVTGTLAKVQANLNKAAGR